MKNNRRKLDDLYTNGKCYPGNKSHYDVWTRGNVAEAFPDVMTPLSWSLWSNTMNELLRNAFRFYSFSPQVKEKCFIMLRGGRLYYNIGLVNHYMKKIGLFAMDSIIGGETAYTSNIKTYNINWIKFLLHFRGNMKSEKSNQKLEAISYKKCMEFKKKNLDWKNIDYKKYSLDKLICLFEDRIRYGKENMYLHTDATTAAFSTMAILQWKLAKCGYDADNVLLNLVTDIDGIEMAGINSLIDTLQNMLRTDDEKQTVVSCLINNKWKESLIENGYQAIYDFIENKFLRYYGHRGKNELEIKEQCWSENPRMLLDMIIERLNKGEAIREGTLLKENIDDIRLNELIEKTRKFTRLRENNKHYLYFVIADIKRIIRAVNNKLCEAMPEMNDDDIYFMSYNELIDLSKNFNNFKCYQKKINERKEIYAIFVKEERKKYNVFQDVKVLSGISACHGNVVGTVRIVDKDSVKKINKGDIIVIKSLDISWTPLFSIAGGLITELGGILSHAAIVAREYNIPAIVNVENATSILKDGDRIRLDGDKGTITYDKGISI